MPPLQIWQLHAVLVKSKPVHHAVLSAPRSINQLLRIERDLGRSAVFRGKESFAQFRVDGKNAVPARVK